MVDGSKVVWVGEVLRQCLLLPSWACSLPAGVSDVEHEIPPKYSASCIHSPDTLIGTFVANLEATLKAGNGLITPTGGMFFPFCFTYE